MVDRVLQMLGIGRKANLVGSGEFKTEESVKGGAAHLVLIATDASNNTKKKFKDMCSFYHVPCCEYGTKETLGRALGQEERSSVCVNDAGMAGKIRDYLNLGGIVNG